jgi:hypothetical protein
MSDKPKGAPTIYLTPCLIVEGTVVDIADCLTYAAQIFGFETDFISYRGAFPEGEQIHVMSTVIKVFATYGANMSPDQYIGMLTIQKMRTRCCLEMLTWVEYEQIAHNTLSVLPGLLRYIGEVQVVSKPAWEILESVHTTEGSNLPPITDLIDQRILQLVSEDPDLTDEQIGERVNLGRQAVNTRRKRLEKMGYSVR